MRRACWPVLGSILCCLLAATSVFADVVNIPVKVTRVNGEIVVLCKEPATLDAVLVEDAGGWRSVTPLPEGITRSASGEVRVVISGTPKRISVEYTHAGEEGLLELDLDTPQRETTATVPDAEGESAAFPGYDGTLPIPEADGVSGPALLKSGPTASPQARNIRVYGRFTYRRPDGQVAGVDGAVVRLYDDDAYLDEFLGSQVTDAQGYFDITFGWDPCWSCDAEPDIYAEFELDNSEVQVQTSGIFETDYSFHTGAWADYTGTNLYMGWQTPSNPAEFPACHIMTNVMRGWRFMVGNGWDTPPLDVQWPDESCPTACYNSFWNEIHVPSGRQWDDPTIVHEYGHHWVDSFGINTPPDYCNGFCDTNPPTQCGHCLWCQETDHDAFNEGFPDWIGATVTSEYGWRYGLVPFIPQSFESLLTCGATGTLHNPWITEGALAALLWDITDPAQDAQVTMSPPGMDALALGADEILHIAGNLDATTPADFINKFRATYPGITELFWQTARNNGYDFDVANPGVVSGLTSDHPAIGNNDPRPYITWSWLRAPDDVSGTVAYSYTVVNGFVPGLPDTIAELTNNETLLVTGPHAPGYYYIAIRAQDRSGKWSSNFVTAGPFGIRPYIPANLRYTFRTGWNNIPVLPRPFPDATSLTAALPEYLSWGPMYLSLLYWNDGELPFPGGYWAQAYNCLEPMSGIPWQAASVPSMQGVEVLNVPVTLGTGRRTIGARLDDPDIESEPSETDNAWAKQWGVIAPLFNTDSSSVELTPPGRNAGTSWIIDGSPIYDNSRGHRIELDTWWTAVSMYPLSLEADYDLNLHAYTSDPLQAFGPILAQSAYGAGAADIVIVNANVAAGGFYDVGVVNYNNVSAGYAIKKSAETPIAYPGNAVVTLYPGEMVKIFEFSSLGGPASLTAQVTDPTVGVVAMGWFPPTFSLGPINTSSATAYTSATTGFARLDVNAPAGFQALVVYRSPNFTVAWNDTIQVTVTVADTPSDMAMAAPPGWAGALVPRADDAGTPGGVAAPPALLGDAAATWINYAFSNQSTQVVPGAWTPLAWILVDSTVLRAEAPTMPGPGGTTTVNLATPETIPGGRHVLAMVLDPYDAVPEIVGGNDYTAGQWVWQPTYPIANDTPVSRGTPPGVYDGFAYMPNGSPLWFNMDGVRTQILGPPPAVIGVEATAAVPQAGERAVIALMPDPGTDTDLRLFTPAVDAENGFDLELTGSYWGPDEVDFVLVDFRETAPSDFDVGIQASPLTPGPSTLVVRNSVPLPNGVQVAGPYTLGAGSFLDAYEVELQPGAFLLSLTNLAGTVDWGMALYPPGQAFASRGEFLPGAIAWEEGAGQDETMNVTIQTAGIYALVVWKNEPTDLGASGDYNVVIDLAPTSVPDIPAATARLIAVSPNPFGGAADIAFETLQDGPVRLVIYDAQGRRVRDLLHGDEPSGRHQTRWDGRTQDGSEAPAGIYFLMLEAEGVREGRKLVRIR